MATTVVPLGMSAEDCRIVRAENQARFQAFLRRIDREIAANPQLAELGRRGKVAHAETKTLKAAHTLTAERIPYEDREWSWRPWQPVCSCGWRGAAETSQACADGAAREERERIFAPLTGGDIRHSQS